jgi:hypothetical protein
MWDVADVAQPYYSYVVSRGNGVFVPAGMDLAVKLLITWFPPQVKNFQKINSFTSKCIPAGMKNSSWDCFLLAKHTAQNCMPKWTLSES